jgi:hypothetical protein
VTLLDPNSPEALEAQSRVGRLCDLPLVTLQPLRHPWDDFFAKAPPWLRALARQPFDPVAELLWKHLSNGLPTEVIPRTPIWVAEAKEGYLLDFLLPQFSVGVVIDWEDPEGEPFWDWWEPMQADLDSVRIEPLSYYAAVVRDDPAGVVTDLRYELGLFDK